MLTAGQAGGGPRPTIDRADPFDQTAALDLAAVAPPARRAAHPFASGPWLVAAAEVLEAGNRVEVLSLGSSRGPARDDEIAGWVAVVIDRDGGARFLGDPLADLTGPILATPAGDPASTADHLDDVAAALASRLSDVLAPGTRLVSHGVPVELARRLHGPTVSNVLSSPVVDIDRTWDDYLRGRSATRRRRIARQSVALLDRPDVMIRDVTDREDMRGALATLVRLHDARFGASSRTFTGRRGEFLTRSVVDLAHEGAARIRVLEIDHEPAAAILVLQSRDDDWFYQGGWDPRFAHLSVGRALFADTVRQAFRCERRSFRLLRGDDPYKSWWATSDRPVATVEFVGGAR